MRFPNNHENVCRAEWKIAKCKQNKCVNLWSVKKKRTIEIVIKNEKKRPKNNSVKSWKNSLIGTKSHSTGVNLDKARIIITKNKVNWNSMNFTYIAHVVIRLIVDTWMKSSVPSINVYGAFVTNCTTLKSLFFLRVFFFLSLFYSLPSLTVFCCLFYRKQHIVVRVKICKICVK